MDDASRFEGGGEDFHGKYLGCVQVQANKGQDVCQEAMQKLLAELKGRKEPKQRLIINLSFEGTRLKEMPPGTDLMDMLFKHTEVSYVWKDPRDQRSLGVIRTEPDPKDSEQVIYKFHGIRTIKPAMPFLQEMQSLFQIVKEQAAERKRQQQEKQEPVVERQEDKGKVMEDEKKSDSNEPTGAAAGETAGEAAVGGKERALSNLLKIDNHLPKSESRASLDELSDIFSGTVSVTQQQQQQQQQQKIIFQDFFQQQQAFGQNQGGQSPLNQSSAAQNHFTPNQFGQNQFSQNQFGQNQFGQNQFCQNQFGQNEFGQNQFGQNQFGQNQFVQNQFGQNRFDQNVMAQNPFGQNQYGQNQNYINPALQNPFGQNQFAQSQNPNPFSASQFNPVQNQSSTNPFGSSVLDRQNSQPAADVLEPRIAAAAGADVKLQKQDAGIRPDAFSDLVVAFGGGGSSNQSARGSGKDMFKQEKPKVTLRELANQSPRPQ